MSTSIDEFFEFYSECSGIPTAEIPCLIFSTPRIDDEVLRKDSSNAEWNDLKGFVQRAWRHWRNWGSRPEGEDDFEVRVEVGNLMSVMVV